MSDETIRLLIADDHRVVREGIKTFLSPNPRMQVVGEACDGQEVVEKAALLKPDVILMDLVMPKMDGIEATRQICQMNPHARILMITSFTEDERVMAAIQAGASGYLLKDSSPQELERAIEVVFGGESYLPPNIASKIIRGINQHPSTEVPAQQFTPREIEIIKLIAQGHSNGEIARILVLSVRTVSSHLWRIMNKLQVDNRTQVALYAVRFGIISKEKPG
jgi:two-component system, NarL family, response regulator LiaR